ncbi:AbiJ-NTD4 domain-containing protein [Frigoribacterium sp. NPDC087798]|uniref:AbiJ-NTD4 domain-containing protein n=1 Tax=Frigoribacterium sp. NPDC087798 TaxID=3363993 RepID=UPI0037F64183
MSSFSERMGYKQARSLVQTDDLDDETRMGLWNALVHLPVHFDATANHEDERMIVTWLWMKAFGRARDEMPRFSSTVWDLVKDRVLRGPFNECMDVIEDVMDATSLGRQNRFLDFVPGLANAINVQFERMLVGYRLINGHILPLDHELEISSVTEATGDGTPAAAREHLSTALTLLSDRRNPDYRNSVKESITAVESLARKITGARTLGEALTKLSASGIETHSALVKAWSGFYGYTSDAGGVRHGSQSVEKVDQALAKYILVICSAFVTWLSEEARIAGKL